jgi:acyl carrier protein
LVNLDRGRIYDVVRSAVEDLNATQPAEDRFEPFENTLLAADGGRLSSLAIVTVILGVEERLSEALSRPVRLFNDSLIADPDGPFRTIGSLVDHIHEILRVDSP